MSLGAWLIRVMNDTRTKDHVGLGPHHCRCAKVAIIFGRLSDFSFVDLFVNPNYLKKKFTLGPESFEC